MTNEKNSQYCDLQRRVLFGMLSVMFFFVCFHRMSTSVIATDLLRTFQVHATALGFMSSMYFYIYALEQPLVGHFSDTIGPRRVVGFWSLISALGCFIFAWAPSIVWATVGRGLIGLGSGGVYVPAMKAFSQWFNHKKLGIVTGLLLASGNIGAIAATTPLAWMAKTWGWRLVFLLIGGITFGLALVIIILRDYKTSTKPIKKELACNNKQSMVPKNSSIQILASLRFWIIALIFFCFFGVFFTFQGLWATPFIMSVLNVKTLQASRLNMFIPLGFIFGAPLFGWLSSKFFRRRVDMLLCLSVFITGAWIILLLYCEVIKIGGMIFLLLIIGGFGGGFAANLWTLIQEITPSSNIGLTAGLLNIFPLLGPAILQIVTGAVLDRTDMINGMYPPIAYKEAFMVCFLFFATCIVLLWYLKKSGLEQGN